MNSTLIQRKTLSVIVMVAFLSSAFLSQPSADAQNTQDSTNKKINYERELESLKKDLLQKIPSSQSKPATIQSFLENGELDSSLVKFVVLYQATPEGLTQFAKQSTENARLLEQLLSDPKLMQQMLVADGAKRKRLGRNQEGPAEFGQAMAIYSKIRKASKRSNSGVLQRLAVAVSLEHSVPIVQVNPTAKTDAAKTVDPVKRYLHFEKAYLDGELDAAFKQLSTWELRMVVDGDEPDETLAWGRRMLRNFRPDHIFNANMGWRYVNIVGSDVKYGSQNVKHDRPELQKYQNILMNGGVCGRRAFFGRFILRAFGIPTIARPSRGHGALAHWTPDGWVVNLGGAWGCGWTKTRYKDDVDFLANTQARDDRVAFMKVKRARWIGDLVGEKRSYAEKDGQHEFWNGTAIQVQRQIIKDLKKVALKPLGEDLAEANESTIAEKILASPVKPADKKIIYGDRGLITIPAAGYSKPKGNTRDVIAMKSFGGGLQVFLPRFFPEGKTIMRGGTWKGNPDACTSGIRMLSGGYGRYENWGLRAAVTASEKNPPKNLKLDLGDGVFMEFVYIQPGMFVMGGESKAEGRFQCVEIPKHDVKITKGFYLGKYEVTQQQYLAIMGANPSRSTKQGDCPVDNVSEADALTFCGKVTEKTGRDVRLPTEAEWEFASRAGSKSKWFFGDDPSKIGDYAWFKGNAGAKSHPVGQKKPNPWGLYDIYGNVCERISDKYARNYYAISPKEDPAGPSQGTKSRIEYRIAVPESGKYLLTAEVVTANYDQRLNLSINKSSAQTAIELPFTEGQWQETKPVEVTLTKGENVLRFSRSNPPQYGVAVKRFKLAPK